MKVEPLETEGERQKYKTDAEPSYVNAIRRSLMGEVETLAAEDVEIYENTSVLYDEIVAHRLGLVPLETEPGEFVPPEECSCEGEGCANCVANLSLQAEAPEEGMTTVYSGDITGDVEPADPDIPVVKLKNGQRLLINVEATLGKGTDHVKWSGAVAATLKQEEEGVELSFETDGSADGDTLLKQAFDKQIEKLDELIEILDDLQ